MLFAPSHTFISRPSRLLAILLPSAVRSFPSLWASLGGVGPSMATSGIALVAATDIQTPQNMTYEAFHRSMSHHRRSCLFMEYSLLCIMNFYLGVLRIPSLASKLEAAHTLEVSTGDLFGNQSGGKHHRLDALPTLTFPSSFLHREGQWVNQCYRSRIYLEFSTTMHATFSSWNNVA